MINRKFLITILIGTSLSTMILPISAKDPTLTIVGDDAKINDYDYAGRNNTIDGTVVGNDVIVSGSGNIAIGGSWNQNNGGDDGTKGSGMATTVRTMTNGIRNTVVGETSVALGEFNTVLGAAATIGYNDFNSYKNSNDTINGQATGNFKITNAVALGSYSSATESNTVSIGCKSQNLTRRLVNLSDGKDENDAVNLKQLNSVKNSIKKYTAGSDISISSANAISVSKNGAIEKENAGIVTGGTVYAVTNKLSNTLDTQKTQLTAATKRLSTMTSTISELKDSIIDINTSVTSAIVSSSATINGRLDTNLSNLSEDGKDSLRQLIRNEMKNINTTSMAKSNVSTLAMPAVFEDHANKSNSTQLDELSKTVENKADTSYVNQELAKKADKAELDKVSTAVSENKEKISLNAKEIEGLKKSKADADGSNIDVSKFTEKLGVGQVEKDNTGLVTGGAVANALERKADLDYVNDGFSRMDSQMQQMNQSLSRDIARVGAGAAALAGLHPQEYDPNNKLDFAAGYGHYKNANATAIGMYYRQNAGTTISLASTIGNGDPMISAGLSFKIGYGKNVEKVILTKGDYDAIQNRMEDQDRKIKEMEQILQNLVGNRA